VQTVLFENLFILIDILIVLRVGMWLIALAFKRFLGYRLLLMFKKNTQEEVEGQLQKHPKLSDYTYNDLHAAAHRLHKMHPPPQMIFEFLAYALWLGSRYIL